MTGGELRLSGSAGARLSLADGHAAWLDARSRTLSRGAAEHPDERGASMATPQSRETLPAQTGASAFTFERPPGGACHVSGSGHADLLQPDPIRIGRDT